MPEAKIIISQIQVALFPIDFKIEDPTDLGYKLISAGLIDQNKPNISPIPKELPDDLNRIKAFLSNSNNKKLEISQAKIGLYIENQDLSEEFSPDIDGITEIIREIAKTFKKISQINYYKRVGFITTLLVNTSDPKNIVNGLLNTKINKPELRDSKLTLTYKTSFVVNADIDYNEYVNIGKGKKMDTDQEVIYIEYDLNTHQNAEIQWSLNDVIKFIKEAKERSEKSTIVNKFFPSL